MKPTRFAVKMLIIVLVLPTCLSAQDDENWPSLSYLKNDYKSVSVVAHVRFKQAEITGRIGGYENWSVSAIVVESFKGRFKKGNVINYFQGAEAGLKQEYFTGEKIVFLLAERERGQVRYSVLENSTLPYTPDRVKKLRLIRSGYSSRRRRTFAQKSKTEISHSHRASAR
ncbi:MAG TPA: hypothetical protein VGQ39_20365 [Pyrinomonadaceae bacterium]|nr:hypothetical protein [Pyrinomonadaceae bacterium]